MFIFDFVAETVLDQIIDWLYGKIVGFLNDFFAMMNNMVRCVKNVKETNGEIDFEDAFRFQKEITE